MKPHLYLAVLALALASSCASDFVRDDRWEQEGYTLAFKDLSGSRITAIEYRALINTRPERLWNVTTDVGAIFNLTGAYRLIDGPIAQTDGTIRMLLEVDPAWYAPAVTTTMIGRLLPDELGWENEFYSGMFAGSYMRFTIVPADDGQRSILNMSGYIKRPWFVSHGLMADFLKPDVTGIGPGVNYLAAQSKYEKSNTVFPWKELRHLSQSGPRPASLRQDDDSGAKQLRVAVQRFVSFPDASTTHAVANVAADYLATQLMGLNKFTVVAPSDLNLMARYLGENWALLCTETDACKKRLAGMAEAQYILSGELRSDAAQYHLSLVLLDESHARAVWRMQKSVPLELHMIKQALDEATTNIGAVALQ